MTRKNQPKRAGRALHIWADPELWELVSAAAALDDSAPAAPNVSEWVRRVCRVAATERLDRAGAASRRAR